MSLAEAPPRTAVLERAPARVRFRRPVRPTTRRSVVSITTLAITAVLAAGVVFRFITTSDLWLDEAISVNVARLPLSEIPSWLRHDGAPPLYYLLLHGWTNAFGTSDLAVRSLSGVFSVATLPAIYFAGRRLGGARCAWAAVLIMASSSFAIRFATEARMYSLVAFLVVLGYLALNRVLEQPSAGRVAALALVVAAMLYTQYWSLYVLAAAGGVLVVLAIRSGPEHRRRGARAALIALAAGAVAFLPWLPTLSYQSEHLRAEFGTGSGIRSVIHDTLFDFSGGPHIEDRLLSWVLVGLLLVAVLGIRVGNGRVELEGTREIGARPEALVIGLVLFLGSLGSYATGAIFYARYASVIFPLFVIVVAYGVSRFADRRVQAAVLVLIVGAGFLGGYQNVVDSRTEAERVAAVISAQARPGDVVAFCPDMVAPAVSRLLEVPAGTTQVAFPDGDPAMIDWVDYIERHAVADPDAFAGRALGRVSSTGSIWFVNSTIFLQGNEGKCEAVRATLDRELVGSVLVRSSKDQEHLALVRYTTG